MSISKVYLLLVCSVFITLHAYSVEKTDTLFKVVKIRTKGDYYIIHAEKNDSLFKIISRKVEKNEPNLELLKRGEYYYFDFGTNNDNIVEEKVEPFSGIANDLDVKNNSTFIDGNTKIKFTKRFHYRLYTTDNLLGLFYVPNPH